MAAIGAVAHSGANDERDPSFAARHVMQIRRLEDELIHGSGQELAKADFHDGTLPEEGCPYTGADHSSFRDWSIADAVRPEFVVQSSGTLQHAAVATHVLPDVKDALVLSHGPCDGIDDGVGLRHHRG